MKEWRNITIGTVVGIVAALAPVWTWVRPNLVFASDLKQAVEPLEDHIEQNSERSIRIELLLLQREQRDLSADIARMEHRRARAPEEWTAEDAVELRELEDALEAVQTRIDSLEDE